MTAPVTRNDVVAMLATYGDRAPEAVRDRIDSLELAWLVHQVEERYGVALDLTDDDLLRMSTVDNATAVLRRVVGDSP
jgi:acyl carrier protein